jgi:hypothetical protein
VNDIGTGCNDIGYFLTQLGKIGGKDTWCDSKLFGHDVNSKICG